jgi:hypothetical protein
MLKPKWSRIDLVNEFIRLPAEITKERKAKSIPINHHVRKVLEGLPQAIHHDHIFT